MSPFLLWTLVAIVGVLVYMWPVLQKEGFQNPYKTVQLENGATLTFQTADEWRTFQEITGGALTRSAADPTDGSTAGSTTGSTTASSTGSATGSATGSTAGSATGSATGSTTGSATGSTTGSATGSTTGSGTSPVTLTSTDKIRIRDTIEKVKKIRAFKNKYNNYVFKTQNGDKFVKDTIDRGKIEDELDRILKKNEWGTSRIDMDLKQLIQYNIYSPILNKLIDEIDAYEHKGTITYDPSTDTSVSVSNRVAIEILKKTLEDIQQQMAKNPTVQFQKPVQTNKLLQNISLLQYKLNQTLQKGWGTERGDMDLKFAVERNTLQSQYDAILKEIQEAEVKNAENDMKAMIESKKVPEECETTKSTPANCKITRQYIATPCEVQGAIARNAYKRPGKKCPEMKDYIHKSKLPDMSQYIRKDSIPCWACKL